tara:strand:- start:1055 stop:1303 length:249 start_codon:yes stop_codon:yes gene_type:complete
MNLKFILLIFIFFFSCSNDEECVIIREKAEKSNSYYFYFSTNYLSTTQPNNLMGNIDSGYASGKVSKEIYEKYEIGDEYCYK